MCRHQGKWNTGYGVLMAVGALTGVLLLARQYAAAHIDTQYDSVHFKSSSPDFGVPPRRALVSWRGEHDDRPYTEPNRGGEDGASPGGQELQPGNDAERAVEIRRKSGLMSQAVAAAIQDGKWRKASMLLADFCDRHRWSGEERDQAEIMRQLEALPAPPSAGLLAALHTYLEGLDEDEAADLKPAQQAFAKVAGDPAAGFLREHALYQQASLAAHLYDYPRAVDLYELLLTQYPRTAKREDALMMIARCGLLPQTPDGRREAQGKAALALLRREFPHTRFRRDLVGLQGRIYLLAGKWSQAVRCYLQKSDLASIERVQKAMPAAQRGPIRARLLAAYLRVLTDTHSYDAFEHALHGADETRQAMTASQFLLFRQLLLQEPETASAYLYYRLYHTETGVKDRRNLAQLADRIVALHPAARLSVPVQVRLAEVYYQDRQYSSALAWADRALRPGLSDRALYVHAATLHKLGRPDAALAEFERLLQRFPDSALCHGGRENIALLSEARHDYGHALDQFFALNYQFDIAYLLDIRMSPEQIAAYLRKLSRSKREANAPALIGERYGEKKIIVTRRNLVTYSLGIRYLRDERWEEARRMLLRMPPKAYIACSGKNREHDWYQTAPLRACDDLERLQGAIGRARTPNQTASAMYRFASYYSTHDLLLLYNLALWDGQREENFQFCWNPTVVSAEDEALVRRYMYAHEVYARSRQICLDLIRRYPDSPTVPYALYRAARAGRHLASFNTWWDEENNRHDYWKECTRLLRRLLRDYPRHPLAPHARKYAKVFADERQENWRYNHSSRSVRVTGHIAARD